PADDRLAGKFVNKTLKELNLRKDYGVEVVLIKKHYDTANKEKEKVITSSPDYRFGLGDSLLIMATQEGLDKIKSKNRY
ncbi:MAG: TrkA C-terminal domain-containing protein, partial [Calditrichaeota bacterium]|nr:TrkA C-terminal domain-containing protein [Calditrichota bacterium]